MSTNPIIFAAEIKSVSTAKGASGDKSTLLKLILAPGSNVTGALEDLCGDNLVKVVIEAA